MSNDYFKAQGWFKNYALNSQDSRGMFQRLVKEDEEAFRLASAESDKIKNMMNKKYGPGTMKYGSQISQPPARPDVIQIDAINAFMRRNPAAEGGQMVKPSVDGLRPGYSGELKLSEVKKLRADGKTTDQIIKKLNVSKGIYEAFVTANKDKLPFVSPNKINKQRLKFLNEEAVKLGYKDFASVPKTEQKQPGVRGYGPRENILRRATRREEGVPEGKGSPGVKRTIAPDRSGLYTEEARAKQLQSQKNTYQATPKGERLQWIADNGKDYDKPKDFIKAYEKHFNHKLGSKADVLFNKDGRIAIGLIDNLTNVSNEPTKAMSDIFFFKKGFSEEEVFKASIIQNNPKIQKQFKFLFKNIFDNVSEYQELGPEGIMEKLKKQGGPLLDSFDFIKAYSSSADSAQTYGGVHRGITRNSLRDLGIPEPHIVAFQSVRQPLASLADILNNLQTNPRQYGKMYNLGGATARKVASQLENFLKGEGELRSIVNKINYTLGNKKFNEIFGGVNFDHTLAKQFGKDYKYLPRNYLLKGQFTSKAFNMFKRDAFDIPLIQLMRKYENGKVSAAEVQNFIDDFNKKTNGYADFSFDANKKKLAYTDNKVKYDLSKYANPGTAKKELMDNIKLTMSDEFQKGFKKSLPIDSKYASKDMLKTFKSKEAKDLLKMIESIGCPNAKAEGGRIGFAEGGDCFDKGQKLINNGMKGATPAAAKNFTKFLNTALRYGRNIMRFGVIPEAMYIGAESVVRMGMGDTLSEASKQAVGFYLDPIFGTNFKKEGAFSKMAGDVGSEMAFDVAKLNEYKKSLAKVESIKSNKQNALAVNDESLTGLTDQEVTAQYDKFIADAQTELNKKMLTETERVDFENKADTAEDVAGVKSPIRQAIGQARADTEMMRYEDDFSGMQSDMFTQDPMSAKAKKDSLSNLLPQKSMTPRLSKFVNLDDRQIEKLSGLTKRPVEGLRDYQDYLNKERAMSLLEQERIFGKEQTYGTQGNFFGEQIKQKPVYDFSEGGITALRSKYEYKK